MATNPLEGTGSTNSLAGSSGFPSANVDLTSVGSVKNVKIGVGESPPKKIGRAHV